MLTYTKQRKTAHAVWAVPTQAAATAKTANAAATVKNSSPWLEKHIDI